MFTTTYNSMPLTLRVAATQSLVLYAYNRMHPDKAVPNPGALRSSHSELRAVFQAASTIHKHRDAHEASSLTILLHIDALRTTLDAGLVLSQKQERDEKCAQVIANFQGNLEKLVRHLNVKWRLRDLVDNIAGEMAGGQLSAYAACIEIAHIIWNEAGATGQPKIVREIRFAPEHQQAGISILSYFAVVLSQKLPDVAAEVSIAQIDDRVIMTIAYPDGRREEVSHLLQVYGGVISGDTPIESVLTNPIHAFALKNKLEIVQLELRQTRELLDMERRYASNRFETAESENVFLRQQLAAQLEDSRSQLTKVAALIQVASSQAKANISMKEIETIAEAVVSRDKAALSEAVNRLELEREGVLEKLSRFLFVSATSGSIGNATYEWLRAAWPLLPK